MTPREERGGGLTVHDSTEKDNPRDDTEEFLLEHVVRLEPLRCLGVSLERL